ncbi:MAG: Hsp20/alpha crystallin family protein [Desulfovibrio sp.]|jgi:HSP20 family protein|nr:Hsp20/alpha crystallin family protein [Desulfovibrio sp.]
MTFRPVNASRQSLRGSTLVPSSPTTHEFSRFDGLDRLFNVLLDGLSFHEQRQGGVEKKLFQPPLEVLAEEGQYVINVEIPGVEENKLKVEVKENSLHISGEKERELRQENDGAAREEAYYSERRFGTFARILTLPDDADTEAVSACSKNGVLTLTLLRKKPDQGRVIDVVKQ